jgi:hypothetical protein
LAESEEAALLTRTLTRIVMGIALMCGTVAWSGWAYLNTVAAPHRVEDVANAVVGDSDARLELAGPLADQIVESVGLDPALTPQVRNAVASAFADPRVAANVTAAFGSAHARAVGVDDQRPSTIDGALLVSAVKEQLAVADPALAALIPDVVIDDLHLPQYRPPLVASLRSFAVSCTNWLALAAVALLACALIIGDRKYALRRFGIWAIVTGLLWAIGPRLFVMAAHRWATDVDATIDAAVGAATGTVTAAATALVVAGVGALVVAQFFGLGWQSEVAPEMTVPQPAARRAAPPRRAAPAYQQATPASALIDTYEPGPYRTPVAGLPRTRPPDPPPVQRPAATPLRPPPAPSQPPPLSPASSLAQLVASTPASLPRAADDPSQLVDPWAHFSQPTPTGDAVPVEYRRDPPPGEARPADGPGSP